MPRIVGGSARGRVIKSPSGVRPATARARKSLFDYLSQYLPNINVLDLYCGSGGLGLEALSRGAAQAYFVDKSRLSVEYATKNATTLKFADRAKFMKRDVFAFLKNAPDYQLGKFELIFAAPPYKIAEPLRILDAVADSGLIAEKGLVCLEYSRHTQQPQPEDFSLDRHRKYGETIVEMWEYKGD